MLAVWAGSAATGLSGVWVTLAVSGGGEGAERREHGVAKRNSRHTTTNVVVSDRVRPCLCAAAAKHFCPRFLRAAGRG